MHVLTVVQALVVAQAEAPSQPDAGAMSGWTSLLFPLMMFAVIYFLLIRPAGKQRKQQQELLASLKKDDEVITSAGFFGKIIAIDDKLVTLEIADKVKIKMLRDRIAGRTPEATPAEKK